MRGVPAKLWDVFALAIIDATEISLESRLRLSRILWFIGKIASEKSATFSSMEKLKARLEEVQNDQDLRVRLRNKVEEVIRDDNRTKSGRLICDPDSSGDYLDNCVICVYSALQFIIRYVSSLRK